jgi:hypothetical protein
MKYILHTEYLKAQKIVDEYQLQLKQCAISITDLVINQKVKRASMYSSNYWVSEILGEDVLVRTTENVDDPYYNDFFVNIAELRLVK